MVLPREFYRRPVLRVARDLLGMTLVRTLEGAVRLEGTIVEVEAYDGPDDRASHAWHGLTPRTEPMFGDPGRAYVYFVYGMHCCLNAVTGPPGHPSAVLIRAVAPTAGVESMDPGRAPGSKIASGPGRLTRAFRIDLSLNRADLCFEGSLFIAEGKPVSSRRIVRGDRIGVEYAGEWARKPWRFGIKKHPALSRSFEERLPSDASSRAPRSARPFK